MPGALFEVATENQGREHSGGIPAVWLEKVSGWGCPSLSWADGREGKGRVVGGGGRGQVDFGQDEHEMPGSPRLADQIWSW